MKKKLVKGFGILVIVAVILAVGIFVWLQISKSTKGDDSFRDNDFSFYIDKDMKGLVLNKYFGIQENLVIPNEVKKGEKTYPVVCIDAAVFASCETMKSVVISDNVLKIGAEAFSSCKNLKYVKVGKSVAHFGKYVFSNTP
ncbi:MAG: leucine-rich repeat protein, partial [Clostridia bacterium]